MRSGGCIDVGRGGALGPFSDPADLTKHLAVFSPAFPPAHNRYGPHCRRRHRRSHRRRVPSIRFDAPYTVPPTRPDAMFLRVLATLGTVSVVGRTTFLAQLFRAEPISKRFLTER